MPASRWSGVTFLVFGYRLLPAGRKGSGSTEAAFNIEDYTTEATLPADSPLAGKTVAELEALGDGEVTVTAIIREHFRRYAPASHWMLYPDDVLILQGEPAALERVMARARLKLATKEVSRGDLAGAEVGVVEAVIGGRIRRWSGGRRLSWACGRAIRSTSWRSAAAARSMTQRLRAVRFRAGDVIVLQGDLEALPDTLAELGCLPLAPRGVIAGRRAQRLAAGGRAGRRDAVGVAAARAGDAGVLRRRGRPAAASRRSACARPTPRSSGRS